MCLPAPHVAVGVDERVLPCGLGGRGPVTGGVEDDVYDVRGCGDQRGVVDRAGTHMGGHPLGLEELAGDFGGPPAASPVRVVSASNTLSGALPSR